VTLIVADASVAVKWVFPFRDDEADSSKAIALIDAFKDGTARLLEPPHWLAEMAAVISRLSPATAKQDIGILCALRVPVVDTPELYTLACELAATTGQHAFDTLYHAVALLAPVDRVLVTADQRYYERARQVGAIVLLSDFDPSTAEAG
jgi:predicted nucleic acid-binding protein